MDGDVPGVGTVAGGDTVDMVEDGVDTVADGDGSRHMHMVDTAPDDDVLLSHTQTDAQTT